MADRWAVVLAVVVAAGARLAVGVPLWVAVGAAGLALVSGRPVLLCLGAALLASALGARAWAGMAPPPGQIVEATVTILTDPVDRFGAVRADVRWEGRRVELAATGGAAAAARTALAGERLRVRGELEPLPARLRAAAVPRHVVGRLTASRAEALGPAAGAAGFANDLRRTLTRGARVLPDQQRALFTGFVIGDDRAQDDETRERFRAAGLSHLLAVSGQNVAFALAVVAPALRRFGLAGRLAGNLAVLALFGTLTRWEPSVLRAEAMAAITLLAVTWGRSVSGVRVLALAVTVAVLVDPLLVWSVGFGLSVGACLGIALLGPRLSRRLPGPKPLATAVAITVSAQIGVLPVLLPVFGGVPLAALPANVLAAPVAGPVMVWGLSAGVVAGLVDHDIAVILHTPTVVLVGWIDTVARGASALPLPTVP